MTKEHTSEEIKYRLSDLGAQIGNIAINYITELEKENAELKSLKDVADLIRLNNSSVVAMAQLNNNNVALRQENAELKERNEKLSVLFADVIEAFISRSYNDDFEMAQAGKEIYELFNGGKDPKEVFHNAEVPKSSRQLLENAKELLEEFMRIGTACDEDFEHDYTELIVRAEDFLKECE